MSITYSENIYDKASSDKYSRVHFYTNSTSINKSKSLYLNSSGSSSIRYSNEEEYFLEFSFRDYLYLDFIKSHYNTSETLCDELEVYGFRFGKMEKISETIYNPTESNEITITVKDKSFNKIRILFRNNSEKTRAQIRSWRFRNAIDTSTCYYYNGKEAKFYNLEEGVPVPLSKASDMFKNTPNGMSDISKIGDFELLEKMKKEGIDRVINVRNTDTDDVNGRITSYIPYNKDVINKNLHVFRKPYIIHGLVDIPKSLDFNYLTANGDGEAYKALFKVGEAYYGFDRNGLIKKVNKEEDFLKYSLNQNQLRSVPKQYFEKITGGNWNVKLCLLYVSNGIKTTNSSIKKNTSNYDTNENKPSSILKTLEASNRLPKSVIKEDKNDFIITLEDEDSDYLIYKIYVNDKLYYPSEDYFEKSYKELKKTLRLDSRVLEVGKKNSLKIVYEDSWGERLEDSYKFTYNYRGLMFIDPKDNKFYSTEFGKIIKRLQAGLVLSGKTSEVFKIKLRNTNKFDVVNPSLSFIIPKDIPKKKQEAMKGLGIEFSKKETPFAEQQYSLSWENQILRQGSEVEFFIRVFAEKESKTVKDGELDIIVNATDIDYYKGDKKKLKYIV